MLQGEHSAILSTFIKLPFVIKTFVLSTFEWPLRTCFAVFVKAFGIAPIINQIGIFRFRAAGWEPTVMGFGS